jgi:3-deoxy-manno-octulosonate cytidylyltransferase (CMP-KDO synthetase)
MSAFPRCYGIVPARYHSTRFPGKALAEILGKPMVWHVVQQARQCPALTAVVLATDDERIRSAVAEWKIPVVMTSKDHPSGTDRVLEAAQKLQLPCDAVVVNIQGDEPTLEPAMLTELLQPFTLPQVQVTTLARKMNFREAANPDRVKVVFTTDGRALYFSRAPIPYHRTPETMDFHGHIGIYAFRMSALTQFVALKQGRLELTEKLEQLRLLENNIPIHVVVTNYESIGVDRPTDLKAVIRMMQAKNHPRSSPSVSTARRRHARKDAQTLKE